MDELEKALLNERNSPMVRAFLWICKCQNSSVFEESMMNLVSGANIEDISGIIGCGLLSIANKETIPPTKMEISNLFSRLVEKFNGKDFLQLYIDYGPEGGPVTEVLREWFEWIKKERKPEEKLPIGWGLPCKTMLRVEEGCAVVSSNVLNDHGDIMKKNPHEIAYYSENPSDIEKAFHLQPIRPENWENKFTNRNIAKIMNYTFEKDAIKMTNTKNWGILSYLIENSDNDEKFMSIGNKILSLVCYYDFIQHEIMIQLLEKGSQFKKYMGYDGAFFKSIELSSNYYLLKILEIIKNKNYKVDDLERMKKSLIWSIQIRYLKNQFNLDEFYEILNFWVWLNSNNSDKCDDVFEKERRLEICKGVVNGRDLNCKDKILEIIKELEKSPEVVKFELAIAEIKRFPSYYSGYSSYAISFHAQPVLDRLYKRYKKLSDDERKEYKLLYENANQFLKKY